MNQPMHAPYGGVVTNAAQRNRVLRNTYALLAVSLLPTVAGAWLGVATGLVALLFQPVRQRIQQAVNRLIYGDRDDPYAAVARLGQRLEDQGARLAYTDFSRASLQTG